MTIREASGLKDYLLDPKFIFLLETYKLIFEQTDVVFSILQNKLTDIACAKKRLISLVGKLKEFRNDENYFNFIYGNITDEAETQNPPKKRKVTCDLPNESQHYRQIFIEILETCI